MQAASRGSATDRHAVWRTDSYEGPARLLVSLLTSSAPFRNAMFSSSHRRPRRRAPGVVIAFADHLQRRRLNRPEVGVPQAPTSWDLVGSGGSVGTRRCASLQRKGALPLSVGPSVSVCAAPKEFQEVLRDAEKVERRAPVGCLVSARRERVQLVVEYSIPDFRAADDQDHPSASGIRRRPYQGS